MPSPAAERIAARTITVRPITVRADRLCGLCQTSIPAGTLATSVPTVRGRRGWLHVACAAAPDAAIFGRVR